jgi:hypothetical protein
MDYNVQEIMRRAGWSEERDVDPVGDENALQLAGYAVWPEVTRFLAVYSGLTFTDGNGKRKVWIDAARSASEIDRAWVISYEALAESILVPVGGYSHMTIFLSASGALYGGYDREFGLLGADLEGSLHPLLVDQGSLTLNMRVSDD